MKREPSRSRQGLHKLSAEYEEALQTVEVQKVDPIIPFKLRMKQTLQKGREKTLPPIVNLAQTMKDPPPLSEKQIGGVLLADALCGAYGGTGGCLPGGEPGSEPPEEPEAGEYAGTV